MANGSSIVTQDGGATWNRVNSESGFVDWVASAGILSKTTNEAWAFSRDGILYRTRSGGQSWEAANVPQHEAAAGRERAAEDGISIGFRFGLGKMEKPVSDNDPPSNSGSPETEADFAERFQAQMSDQRRAHRTLYARMESLEGESRCQSFDESQTTADRRAQQDRTSRPNPENTRQPFTE